MPKEPALDQSAILEFMALRPARSINDETRARHYIRDLTLYGDGDDVDIRPIELLSDQSPSAIARMVYQCVIVSQREVDITDLHPFVPEVVSAIPSGAARPGGIMTFAQVEDRALFAFRFIWFLVPDRVTDLQGPGIDLLLGIREALRRLGAAADLPTVKATVLRLLHQPSVHQGYFAPVGDFVMAPWVLRRLLFDRLYLLYSLRKIIGGYAVVRMEDVITALQTLHVLEALAIDDAIAHFSGVAESSLTDTQRNILTLVKLLRPEIADWVPGYGITQAADLLLDVEAIRDFIQATPVIHPLFSHGTHYLNPFSRVKPIGVGDLKVVRQRLLEYRAGEISYIHNVLKGETRERKFRRLERSEDTFVTSSEQSQESQSEHQATDRFELQREAQDVMKQAVGVNVNGSVTYNGVSVVAAASTGFSYQGADEKTSKSVEHLVKEVVDKSVARVVSRISEQRTSVRLTETEENNTQTFDAKEAQTHISGIYRWVEKKYEAQLWNVGRRMMFEFIIPEPAHFLVESRLRAYAQNTPLPDPPKLALTAAAMPPNTIPPTAITDDVFAALSLKYDLSDLPHPSRPQVKTGFFADASSGEKTITGLYPGGMNNPDTGQQRVRTHSYRSRAPLEGYQLQSIRLMASLQFYSLNEGALGGMNRIQLFLDGVQITTRAPGDLEWWVVDQDIDVSSSQVPLHDDVEITLALQDIISYAVTISYTASRVDDGIAQWQRDVQQRIHSIEQAKADDANRRLQAQYDADLARYNNQMAELKAQVASELLQGSAGQLNTRAMMDELKRHCLSILTQDFDSNTADDRFRAPTIASRTQPTSYYTLVAPSATDPSPQRFSITLTEQPSVQLPAIDLGTSASRAPYVQFLEQAFEWSNLAYVFYPYFWGPESRWIDMMNRVDGGDPLFTAFLQAGSARVLLAATPGYEHAVLHFTATGQPWDGGPTPAIDDPLYLPVYEEIRRQQQADTVGEREGSSWNFILPTSLVYLQDSTSPLPEFQEPT